MPHLRPKSLRTRFLTLLALGGSLVASAGLWFRKLDLDGVTLTYGAEDNQGMDQVFLTVIQPDGRFKAVSRLEQ